MCKLLRIAFVVSIILVCNFCGCSSKSSSDVNNVTFMKNKSIEQALKENTNQWMSIPGVEGVAIGQYKGKSCIRIFTSKESAR
jgi:hypothetical protein